MGSSGEEPNKSIDATVGGLVWVRRRNGSWWPGKILGPEDLPEGCVPTPRAGTPVKLLGREDASVDWYNLEKSKRVKAFHCGEYDDCIKKVKESASHLSKKAAKYARREDAILHALELERACLGINHPDLSALPITQNGDDESPSTSRPSEESGDLNRYGDDLDSAHKESNDSEDDGCEGVKRMRGLEDLGMGVTSSLKKKRSQVAYVHGFLKRKSRHVPLTKVMASAVTMVSGLESNKSKKDDSFVTSNNSDSNGISHENGALNASKDASPKGQQKDTEKGYSQELSDVLLADEERHSKGVSNASQPAHVDDISRSSQDSRAEFASLPNKELHGSDSTTSRTQNIENIEKGPCEWRFKGKRNSRLRKVDNMAETYLTNVDSKNIPQREATAQADPIPPQRLLPYRHSRSMVNPKYDDSDIALKHHISISGLHDVKVEVKSDYRPHHVPYISLMSKLTGRPIIGHPLTFQVMDNGSSDSELYGGKPCGRPQTSSPRSRRKNNTLLSNKTRKLSLLSREEKKKPVVEKLKGPSIACVPLKIAFSRINAALTSKFPTASNDIV